MSPLREIRLLTAPLAIKKDAPKFVGVKEGKFSMTEARRALKHKDEYSYFYRIDNWTLEIDGWCYELVPLPLAKFKAISVGADPCKIKVTKSKEWQEIRDKAKIDPVVRKVGVTRKTHKEIEAEGLDIWKRFNNQKYLWLAQKGQNFAKQLIESIAVPADDPDVLDKDKEQWEAIPEPISCTPSKGTLTKGSALSISITRVYITALYPATGALEMGAAGGAVVVGTVEAGGATGAAGTASTAGAGTATTAGTGTATTAGTGTASTAGASTATTAGTGTSHGTAAGAGKAGLFGTKGAAAGSASSGKVGIGAKFAGLGHGAAHGAATGAAHGAAGGKAALLAKAGTAVMVAHPITAGVMVVGASGIAARKLYKTRQKKKNGQFAEPSEDDMGELTVLELLQAEEQALDEKDSTAEEMNEIDEELMEELDGLTIVATEPGIVAEPAIATEPVIAIDPAIATESVVAAEPIVPTEPMLVSKPAPQEVVS
ncbi:MAG: hypothetical protein Q9160_000686 [Pyrenula sp. 1 TL-2023]